MQRLWKALSQQSSPILSSEPEKDDHEAYPTPALTAESNVTQRNFSDDTDSNAALRPSIGQPIHRAAQHADNYFLDEYDPTLEDAEMAELGLSNEILDDELYLPAHPSRDWIRCYVSTTGPGTFRMYLDGRKRARFLMSAKQFSPGTPFLISTNEDFPMLETVPHNGFVAWLERQRDNSYFLNLNHCHLCDYRLGKFSCGRSDSEREVIAKITHSFRVFRMINLQYRCVSVQVPSISQQGKRKIWCPRSLRYAFGSAIVGEGTDVNSVINQDKDKECSLVLRNRDPIWNDDLKSLTVKFHGNRILTASTRNFLLCADRRAEDANSALTVNYYSENDEMNQIDGRMRTSSQQSTSSMCNQVKSSESDKYFSDQGLLPPAPPSLRDRLYSTESLMSCASPTSRAFHTIDAVQAARKRRTKSIDLKANASNGSAKLRARSRSRSRTNSLTGTISRENRSKTFSMSSQSSASVNTDTTPTATPRTFSKSLANGCAARSQDSADDSQRMSTTSDDFEPILQFGKCSMTRFVLDFKFPLSPLQAFGIALASFANDEFDNRIEEPLQWYPQEEYDFEEEEEEDISP